MMHDSDKYDLALFRQQWENDGGRVVKVWWTPECLEVVRRDGKVVKLRHDYRSWSCVEVKP